MRLTTKEAASRLGMTVGFLRAKLKSGELRDICDTYVNPSGRCTYVFYDERIEAHMKGGRHG